MRKYLLGFGLINSASRLPFPLVDTLLELFTTQHRCRCRRTCLALRNEAGKQARDAGEGNCSGLPKSNIPKVLAFHFSPGSRTKSLRTSF